MANEDNNEVYHNLTESVNAKSSSVNQKWTLYLILCCITVCTASFTFGYNIGSTNLPTPLIKDFFARNYFKNYFSNNEAYLKSLKEHEQAEASFISSKKIYDTLKANSSTDDAFKPLVESLNLTSTKELDDFLNATAKKLDSQAFSLEQTKTQLKESKVKVDEFNTLLWTVTTALFVVGGMVGAFTSKYVADYFGRKKGILFHHIFTVAGAVLVFIAPYVNSPECVIISRFLYGIQGGMSCGLIPTYLSEISPAQLRGATGVVHQLCLTVGILIAQTLGFRQLLGIASLWHILLALPLVPCFLGCLALLLFFPESPRALLINNKDENAARLALTRLRNQTDVSAEIEEMDQEAKESKSDSAISLKELFTAEELRWPLITGLILQLAQQLCGINAGIFRNASIKDEHIQYAVFLTGLINVLCTILCVPLIDKLGRKPLLVYPMFLIILDFLLLTGFLIFQSQGMIFSYLSIICIIVFIMCFAVGLGPIPFLYVAECFKQDSRSAALAICMFTNWVANLMLTLTFPYLAKLLTNYVFLVFTVIVALAVVVILKKVPETKGKSIDEIMAFFQGKKPVKRNPEETGKLMSSSKV